MKTVESGGKLLSHEVCNPQSLLGSMRVYYINNTILTTGIKSRRSKDLVKRYNEHYKEILLSGIIPVLNRMDNEVN